MTNSLSGKRFYLAGALLISAALVVLLIIWGTGFRGSSVHFEDVVGNILKKNELVSKIRIELLQSVQAEKSAVLATTDEDSKTFARQALEANAVVEQIRQELGKVIQEGHIQEETKLLGQFDECWGESKGIDATILEYAVQNTNIKAALLSRDKAYEIVDDLDQTLSGLQPETNDPTLNQAACTIMKAVLRIQALHAPHIIAASDVEMDFIESSIQKYDAEARHALEALNASAESDEGKTLIDQAQTLFKEFMQATGEIIQLSRQNSNIRSLELSLGKKRNITAHCEETLTALQKAVESRSFKATR